MYRFIINNFDYPSPVMWRTLFFAGVLVVLFGILVIFVPEILVFIIASILLFIGFFLITISLQIRAYEKKFQELNIL